MDLDWNHYKNRQQASVAGGIPGTAAQKEITDTLFIAPEAIFFEFSITHYRELFKIALSRTMSRGGDKPQ